MSVPEDEPEAIEIGGLGFALPEGAGDGRSEHGHSLTYTLTLHSTLGLTRTLNQLSTPARPSSGLEKLTWADAHIGLE